MNNKVWVPNPILYLLCAGMLAVAGVTFLFSFIAAIVELCLALALCIIVTILCFRFNIYVRKQVKLAVSAVFSEEHSSLEKFFVPICIVGKHGELIWGNKIFYDSMDLDEKNSLGLDLNSFFEPFTLDNIVQSEGTKLSINNKHFNVYGEQTRDGYILFCMDITEFSNLKDEHRNSRPIVMLACFDNKEELLRDIAASEETYLVASFEQALNEWTKSLCGFSRKLSGGHRYLIFTDEKHYEEAEETRFDILDKVRQIKTEDGRSATASIGIARGASSLVEADIWAKEALDMALGRGGDQVSVKRANNDYSFFGGLSKGVERRDKVRTRVISASISDHVNASDKVFVMGHKFSDLDAVGASVGMWSAVYRGLKKECYIVINKNETQAKSLIVDVETDLKNEGIEAFITSNEACDLASENSLVIVVDTHTPDFVESRDLLTLVERVIVIDHHRMMVNHIDDPVVFFHEPYASSASEMVTELCQYISGNTLTKTEAEALMAGIMLDTKSFVVRSGVRTFDAASYLRRRGADTVEVKKLFSESIDTYKSKFKVVSSAEVYGSYAIAVATDTPNNIRVVAAQAADELLTIEGVIVSFVIFNQGDGAGISARSLGDVNVQLIMEKLGGGGHMTMAGVQIQGVSLDNAKQQLIDVLNTTLAEATVKN